MQNGRALARPLFRVPCLLAFRGERSRGRLQAPALVLLVDLLANLGERLASLHADFHVTRDVKAELSAVGVGVVRRNALVRPTLVVALRVADVAGGLVAAAVAREVLQFVVMRGRPRVVGQNRLVSRSQP